MKACERESQRPARSFAFVSLTNWADIRGNSFLLYVQYLQNRDATVVSLRVYRDIHSFPFKSNQWVSSRQKPQRHKHRPIRFIHQASQKAALLPSHRKSAYTKEPADQLLCIDGGNVEDAGVVLLRRSGSQSRLIVS